MPGVHRHTVYRYTEHFIFQEAQEHCTLSFPQYVHKNVVTVGWISSEWIENWIQSWWVLISQSSARVRVRVCVCYLTKLYNLAHRICAYVRFMASLEWSTYCVCIVDVTMLHISCEDILDRQAFYVYIHLRWILNRKKSKERDWQITVQLLSVRCDPLRYIFHPITNMYQITYAEYFTFNRLTEWN